MPLAGGSIPSNPPQSPFSKGGGKFVPNGDFVRFAVKKTAYSTQGTNSGKPGTPG